MFRLTGWLGTLTGVTRETGGDSEGSRRKCPGKSPLSVSILLAILAFAHVGYANPIVINPSFEQNSNPGVGYGSIDGWTRTGQGGVNPSTTGSSPFANNGVIPDGSRVAFLQQESSIGQLVSGFEVGREYVFEYRVNARRSYTVPLVWARVDGVLVDPVAPVHAVGGNNPYRTRTTASFVATDESVYFSIFGTPSPAGGDSTVLIDSVSVSVVPEPSALYLTGRWCGRTCIWLETTKAEDVESPRRFEHTSDPAG